MSRTLTKETAMELKLALQGHATSRFVEVIAEEDWVAQHAGKDSAETAAIAIEHAQLGLRTFELLPGVERKLTHIRLSKSKPSNAVSLFSDEITLEDGGLSCWICLCDDSGHCVCRPC